MNNFLYRAAVGVLLTGCAAVSIHFGFVIEAIFPALASVIVLGSVLLDALRRNY